MFFKRIIYNNLFPTYHNAYNKILKTKSTLRPILHELNQNYTNKDKTAMPNKWIILLTMAVNVNGESEYRKKLYKNQILKWLHYTNYHIYVVESTGVDLNITHERLKYVSFNLPKLASSSQSEASSMLYMLNQIKDDENFIKCTHILKVTGRYFLENINSVLNNCTHNLDVYPQHHYNHLNKWQHTEYYGIRKTLIEKFLLTVVNEGLIENKFYEFIFKNKLTFSRIGPFKNNIRRGGDNRLIRNL